MEKSKLSKKSFLDKFKFKLPSANRYEILFFNKDEFNNIMIHKNVQNNIRINMPSDIVSNGKININRLSLELEKGNTIEQLGKELDKENHNTLEVKLPNINNKEIKNKYELLRKLSYFGMYFNYTNEETLKKRFNRNQPFNYKFYNNSNPLYNMIKSSKKKFKSFIINKVYNSYKKNKEKIIQGIKNNLEKQNINKSREEIENIVNGKIITRDFVSNCIETIPEKIILNNNDIQVIKNITNNPNDIKTIKNIKNNENKMKTIKEINIKNIQEILELLKEKTNGYINYFIILDIKKDSRIGSIKNIKIKNIQKGGNIFEYIFRYIRYFISMIIAIVIAAGICVGMFILSGGIMTLPGCAFGLGVFFLLQKKASNNFYGINHSLQNELLE